MTMDMFAKTKKWGYRVIFAAVVIELVCWPSLENFAGCCMTVICWTLFASIGLNRNVVRYHTFGWLVFLSMSLYRILPLLATMLEFHSIGYNFVIPFDTYFGETILYIVSAFAFYLVVKGKTKLNGLRKVLLYCGFYDRVTSSTLWVLGIVGLVIRFYLMGAGVRTGDVVGKTLIGFTFFQYAPILLFFPSLYGKYNGVKQVITPHRGVIIYTVFLFIVSFATNSRYALLEPIGTFALLVLLSFVRSDGHQLKIKTRAIAFGFAIVFVGLPILSDISLAMLANRAIRADVDKTKLLVQTMNTFFDRDKMEELHRLKDMTEANGGNDDGTGWSETYVSNFAFNRYCNLKVTDNTLFYAERAGFANEKMYEDFWNEEVALLPSPMLKAFGISYDKDNRSSRGDKLKALSTNTSVFASYLVTSHLADGLVTFGYFYFPIEFVLFYLRFLFLDTFLICKGREVKYSIFGLITIFSFLAMFRNAGGCCDSLGYLLRGYWQDVILFIIVFAIIKNFAKVK